VTLSTLLLILGCSTSDRIDEKSGEGSGLEIDEPSIPDSNKTNQDIVPITPSPAEDNNDSSSQVTVNATNAYKLSMTLSQSKFQQFESGILTYKIKELYSDTLVDSAIIKKITFSVDDTRYFKFVDFNGRETNTFSIDSTEKEIKPENIIRVKMNDNSGTTQITVSTNIELPDGSVRELSNTIPVVVIKNKTASITVNPYGTKWIKDGENAGLFVEKYVFHVVDKYGNKAKDGTSVKIGVVNEPKLYTLGHKDYYSNTINKTGTIHTDKTFTINSDENASFMTHTIDNEDNLVILPNQIKNDPTYLGAWSINHVTDANTITLMDDYTGNIDPKIPVGDTSGLTFVVGDEDRYNPCSKTLANAAFYFPEGAEVKDGTVYAELRYQPYMFGKTVFVYANAVIDGERIGIAREMHLLGEGLNEITASCKNETNIISNCSVFVPMAMNNAGFLARWTQPGYADNTHPVTVSNTECSGGSLVTFYNIAPGKEASAKIGGLIVWEKIVNK
jgi:hypothetical protein